HFTPDSGSTGVYSLQLSPFPRLCDPADYDAQSWERIYLRASLSSRLFCQSGKGTGRKIGLSSERLPEVHTLSGLVRLQITATQYCLIAKAFAQHIKGLLPALRLCRLRRVPQPRLMIYRFQPAYTYAE